MSETKTKQQQADEREILALIDRWSRAVEAKDSQGIVEAYTDTTVLYDAIPPFKTVGGKAIAKLWDDCFPYFPETFRSEHKDLEVSVDGDVAFVHGFHHFAPVPEDHPSGMTWMRVTACYRRIDGQWRVVHEHVSVPFDPMSSRAAYISDPDKPDKLTFEGCGTDSDPSPIGAVTPHLVCAGASQAIEFYKAAFGAKEVMRIPAPDGALMHACITINGAAVMLADDICGPKTTSEETRKGSSVSLHLKVVDADAAAAQAIAAGAKLIMPVADMFWGDRYGVVEDPYGHQWSVAHSTGKQMSESELQEAAREFIGNGPCAA